MNYPPGIWNILGCQLFIMHKVQKPNKWLMKPILLNDDKTLENFGMDTKKLRCDKQHIGCHHQVKEEFEWSNTSLLWPFERGI